MTSLLTKTTALGRERNGTECIMKSGTIGVQLGFDTWPGSGCEFSRIKLLDTYRDTTFETLGIRIGGCMVDL
jgi:hypothetical protein